MIILTRFNNVKCEQHKLIGATPSSALPLKLAETLKLLEGAKTNQPGENQELSFKFRKVSARIEKEMFATGQHGLCYGQHFTFGHDEKSWARSDGKEGSRLGTLDHQKSTFWLQSVAFFHHFASFAGPAPMVNGRPQNMGESQWETERK